MTWYIRQKLFIQAEQNLILLFTLFAHRHIISVMLYSVACRYRHLETVVQKAAASSGKSPLTAVATDPVNVDDVVRKLSGIGFFTHLAILAETGVYRNPVHAFFCEVFSRGGSRGTDVYEHILNGAGFQIATPSAESSEVKPKRDHPPRIKNLLAEIDRKMSAQRQAPSAVSAVPAQSTAPHQPEESPGKPSGKTPPAETIRLEKESSVDEPALEKSIVDEPPGAPIPEGVPSPMPEAPFNSIPLDPLPEPILIDFGPAIDPVSEPVPVNLPSAGGPEASITSLECNGSYDAIKGCITFNAIGAVGKTIEIPCIDGVLDFSGFSSLVTLEINDCPIIKSIKPPMDGCRLNEITLNRCQNLGGNIDLSACTNLETAMITGAGKIRIIIPGGNTFETLYIEGCQNPEVVALEANGALSIEFKECEFSQDTLVGIQTLRDHCRVDGLPPPDPAPAPAWPAPPSIAKVAVRIPRFAPRPSVPKAVTTAIKPVAAERVVPVGISNTGNSCYAASLMQLLFQNRQFREAVAELCAKIPPDNNHQKLLHAVNAIFTHLQSGRGACPPELMREFLQLMQDLGYANAFNQDDPTLLRRELMGNLRRLRTRTEPDEILALHAELLPVFATRKIVEPLAQEGSCKTVYFGGTPDERNHLVISPNAGSLEAALDESFGTREWTGANQYTFDGKRVDARESTKIQGTPPPVLTIDVGRVQFGNRVEKNTVRCAFPEHIDMREHMENPGGEPCTYELTSVVAHSGTARGGHYISFIKRGEHWFECNDSFIRPVRWSEIEKSFGGSVGFHATMLSYRQT
jgi:hypothetical protein